MNAAGLLAWAIALATLLQAPPNVQDPADGDSAAVGRAAVPPSQPSTFPLTASAGIAPDTVTVGDHFRVRLQVAAPEGATVEFPPFRLIEPVEAADSLRVARDSAGHWIATYTLVAWTPSDSLVGSFPIRVRGADGVVSDRRVRLRLPIVRSVLPADTSLHVPRPAKAVLPMAQPVPVGRGWVVPVVLLLVLVAGVAWLLLRGRSRAGHREVDPRAAALASLDAIARERLPERGLIEEYHVRTSRVLRRYIREAAGVGEDLTTTELIDLLERTGHDGAQVAALASLLYRADQVKFSGRVTDSELAEIRMYEEQMRRWVSAWPPAPADADPGRKEAA